jgi:hypothetical protein
MSTLNYRTTFSNSYNTCCVCLRGDYVGVYTKGKLLFEIPLTELLKNEEFLTRGRLSYGNYRVRISDFPRWKKYLPIST